MARQVQSTAFLSEIPNPFLQERVDSPWQEIFYDDDQINRTAFERCLEDTRAVRQLKASWGLILHGEPGSGKTHLLQRLRLFTRKDPRTWFIYVPPFPSPRIVSGGICWSGSSMMSANGPKCRMRGCLKLEERGWKRVLGRDH